MSHDLDLETAISLIEFEKIRNDVPNLGETKPTEEEIRRHRMMWADHPNLSHAEFVDHLMDDERECKIYEEWFK